MKKITALFMSVLISLSAICIPAAAASQNIATRYPLRINIDGLSVLLLNEQQKQVPALQYNDSNYLPIRTAGEWLGKAVSWDSATNTVTLSGNQNTKFYSVAEYNAYDYAYVYRLGDTVSVAPDSRIKIVIDGKEQEFKNALGHTVYPLLYRGTVYVPLRSIGELLSAEIAWRDATPEQMPQVSLYTPMTSEQKEKCEAYLLQLVDKCSDYTKTAGSLFDARSDKTKLRDVLDQMSLQLADLKAIAVPDVPYLKHSTVSIMLAADELAGKIRNAYEPLETQSTEELFALKQGSAQGVLFKLATEQQLDSAILHLNNDFHQTDLAGGASAR